MANRFDWNALEQKIGLVLEQYEELNRTKALGVVAACELFEIDPEEAVDAITDGGNDRGVDLFYIDDREGRNNIHLIQVKSTDNFEKSKNNFPASEIDKLISFVNDLSGEDHDALKNANTLLKAKIADALLSLKEPNASIVVHFVSNTAPLVPDEWKRIEAAFARYKAITFEMHDLDAISDYFLEKKAPDLTREITAVDTNHFDRTDQNLRGVVCTVSASDIVDMIRSEEDANQVESAIFDQNVRVYLKRRNRINKTIIASALADENHMFWYQNNGITMTCDRIEMGPSKRAPRIRLHNVQIVNGGQTSNCLFEAALVDAEKIADVLLLVRIIETTSEEVKLAIAESTNSQTPINVRDLKANDRLQRQLEESFADIGYYYERKKAQHTDKARDTRLDALDSGQAYLAYGVGLPEVAKKDRGRVFGDLYETVFSDEVTAQKLLTSYFLLQLINQHKSSIRRRIKAEETLKPGEISIIDGAFHALFAVRQICSRDGLDGWNLDIAKDQIVEAIGVIQELYVEALEKDENFSSNRFFKEVRTKDLVTRKVA